MAEYIPTPEELMLIQLEDRFVRHLQFANGDYDADADRKAKELAAIAIEILKTQNV